jgi:hypothetical protein
MSHLLPFCRGANTLRASTPAAVTPNYRISSGLKTVSPMAVASYVTAVCGATACLGIGNIPF